MQGCRGVLVNIGKSPITGIHAEAAMEIISFDQRPSFSLKQPHNVHNQANLFPNDSSRFAKMLWDSKTGDPRPFTAEEIGSLTDGTSYLAVFEWIVYTDQFGLHWSRFCGWNPDYSLVRAKGANAISCLGWNRVGDGKSDVPIQ
jgi:hypothetical protein